MCNSGRWRTGHGPEESGFNDGQIKEAYIQLPFICTNTTTHMLYHRHLHCRPGVSEIKHISIPCSQCCCCDFGDFCLPDNTFATHSSSFFKSILSQDMNTSRLVGLFLATFAHIHNHVTFLTSVLTPLFQSINMAVAAYILILTRFPKTVHTIGSVCGFWEPAQS